MTSDRFNDWTEDSLEVVEPAPPLPPDPLDTAVGSITNAKTYEQLKAGIVALVGAVVKPSPDNS